MMGTLLRLLPALCLALSGCGDTYEFQPVSLNETGAARPGRPKESGQFVRALYADLLDRAPQVHDFIIEDESGQQVVRFPLDEADQLRQVLEDVGDPAPLRAILAAGLAASTEAHLPRKADVKDPGAFITAQFQRLLGRDPTIYELHLFRGEWRDDPAVGPATVVRALVGSAEYQSY